MKQHLLAVGLLLITTAVSFSQFGVRGGVSIATFTGDNSSRTLYDLTGFSGTGTIDPISQTGYTAGTSYKLKLLPSVSIEPGVYYVQTGASYEIPSFRVTSGGSSFTLSGKTSYNFNYLQIPIVVKFNLPTPKITPYIESGFAFSILVLAKRKDEVKGPPAYSGDSEVDVRDFMNKSEVAIVLGAGTEISIIDLNIRLVLGQSGVSKDSEIKRFNRSIIITAGIRFH